MAGLSRLTGPIDDSFLTHIRLSLSRDHFLGSVWRLEDNVIVIVGKAITFFEAGSLIGLKLTSSVRLAGQGTLTMMPQSLPPWGRSYMSTIPCTAR